jgi:hypothetical protein
VIAVRGRTDLDAPDFVGKALLPRASASVVFICVRDGRYARTVHLDFAVLHLRLHHFCMIGEGDAAHFVAEASYARCIQAGDTEAKQYNGKILVPFRHE